MMEKTGLAKGRLLERFFLAREDTAVVIIDVQEKLASAMEENAGQQAIKNASRLAEAATLFPIPAIITEQYSKGLGATVEALRASLPEIRPLEKMTFNCCGEPSFMDNIHAVKRKKFILAGMETHICVLQTCLGLLEKGFIVHVASDACCSRKKENHMTGLELMRDAGAVITSVETALFQLAGRAGTEEFRALSKLIK